MMAFNEGIARVVKLTATRMAGIALALGLMGMCLAGKNVRTYTWGRCA